MNIYKNDKVPIAMRIVDKVPINNVDGESGRYIKYMKKSTAKDM